MTSVRTTYCLRDKETRELVRWFTPGSYGDDSTVELAVGALANDWPVWELPTETEVLAALNASRLRRPYETQPSNYLRPSFRELGFDKLELVKRVVEETLSVIPFELAPKVRQRMMMRKPAGVLARYAGAGPLPDGVDHLLIAELPDGESLDSFRRFSGSVLRCESSVIDEDVPVHSIFAVPEDYIGDLNGKPGFAAATKAALHHS